MNFYCKFNIFKRFTRRIYSGIVHFNYLRAKIETNTCKKYYSSESYFLVAQFIYGQTAVHFPSVVLSGVETDFEVESKDQLSNIVINQYEIPLKHLEGTTYSGKIQLTSANIDVEEGAVINELIVIPGWLSILPPLIAILLALLFKEVISALFIGIFIGAATLGFYNDGVMGIFGASLTVLDHYILDALVNPDHLSVHFVFSTYRIGSCCHFEEWWNAGCS